jgi:hypothetical protein
VLRQIRKEEKRLASGWTYEPPTFYERNATVGDRPEADLCQSALPRVAPVSKPAMLPVTISEQESVAV